MRGTRAAGARRGADFLLSRARQTCPLAPAPPLVRRLKKPDSTGVFCAFGATADRSTTWSIRDPRDIFRTALCRFWSSWGAQRVQIRALLITYDPLALQLSLVEGGS